VTRGVLTERGGNHYLVADTPLNEARITPHMGAALARGARAHPERTLFARREAGVAPGTPGTRPGDGWHHLSYAQAWAAARSVAQHLIDLKLSAERPVAIISENSIEHAIVALGCMVAGVPYAPISPAYSLQSQDFGKLKHCLELLTPGLVFAQDSARYGKALSAVAHLDFSLAFAI
jgi:feruloyl-CoA synthase